MSPGEMSRILSVVHRAAASTLFSFDMDSFGREWTTDHPITTDDSYVREQAWRASRKAQGFNSAQERW